MSFDLINFSSSLIKKQAVSEIVKCNDFTSKFGIVLTPNEAIELVETRSIALKSSGRIELGGGVIDKIIKEFCDSPYITKQNYAHTLHELIDMFYYYKNETLDLLSDNDLIKFMKKSFDGVCQGSLELLAGRELSQMAFDLRSGHNPNYSKDDNSKDVEDDYGEY